jgi:hypothetical protein
MFVVTHSFYLAADDDLVDRARVAVSNGLINRLVNAENSEKGLLEKVIPNHEEDEKAQVSHEQ